MRSSKLSNRAQRELDQLLQNAVEQRTIPSVVAVVANRDAILYRGAIGSSTTAIHRIASMTKPITSVSIMMLHERGLLSLDDLVERYLPAFAARAVIHTVNSADGSFTTRPATEPVTIRHLLTHTAGLGYDFCNETLVVLCKDGQYSPETLPLLHDPGSRWTYGHATAILGDIIDYVTGEPFYSFQEKQLLQPLGMFDTGYFLKPADQTRLAPLYNRVNGDWVAETPTFPLKPYLGADGGLLGTAEDYIRFLQMLLNLGQHGDKQLLTPQAVSAMTSNQIRDLTVEEQPGANPALARPFPQGAGQDKFGLGFQLKVGHQANVRSPGSYSWGGLFNTHFWADPHKGIAVVFFAQLLPYYDDAVMQLLAAFEHCLYQHLD